MQDAPIPIEDDDDEASIPMEDVQNGPDLNRTVKVQRRAAKRTPPFELTSESGTQLVSTPQADEIQLVSPAEAEDVQGRKRRRLDKPFPKLPEEATTQNTSPIQQTVTATAIDETTNSNSNSIYDTINETTVATNSSDVCVEQQQQRLLEQIQVGTRVAVYWGGDDEYFSGTVTKERDKDSTKRKRFFLKYDDGDREWIDFSRHKFRVLTDKKKKTLSDEVAPAAAAAASAYQHDDLDLSMDVHPNERAIGFLEENAKLTSALTNNNEKERGKKYKTDWDAVAMQVPSEMLHSSIDPTPVRIGEWIPDEDAKLLDAHQMHNGKNWSGIAALVPGRTKSQCRSRWHNTLDPSVDRTPESRIKWTTDEDDVLTDAVQIHAGTNWNAIAALVPGRTRRQCNSRWHDILAPRADRAPLRTGEWSMEEDIKLRDAVQIHGGKKWDAIAALVSGRTRRQCSTRWYDVLADRTPVRIKEEDTNMMDEEEMHGSKHCDTIAALVLSRRKRRCRGKQRDVLDPPVSKTVGPTDKWTADEDTKLEDAVERHNGKDWDAIISVVPGRTIDQCRTRWQYILASRDGRTGKGRTGDWTKDEDTKLKLSVKIHGGKNWNAIAALVPGRSLRQCSTRWHDHLDSSVHRTPRRSGAWSPSEDTKLKDAVQMHNAKNWNEIAALVPGRTKVQCRGRWADSLDPNIERTFGRTDKWTTDEVDKLRDAVQLHNCKNWDAIALLVPGRNRRQCISKWHNESIGRLGVP
jgi:hypothetical protein